MSLCSSCFHPPSFIDIIDQDDFTEITTLGSVVGRLSKTRKDPPVAVIENVEYTEDVRSMTDELRTAVDNANKYSLEQLQALFREAARMQHLADQHLNEKDYKRACSSYLGATMIANLIESKLIDQVSAEHF